MQKKKAASAGKRTAGAKVLLAAGLVEESEGDARLIPVKQALGHWQGMADAIVGTLKSHSSSTRVTPTGPQLDKLSEARFAHLRK